MIRLAEFRDAPDSLFNGVSIMAMMKAAAVAGPIAFVALLLWTFVRGKR